MSEITDIGPLVERGRIKWYSVVKNYGFLVSDTGEEMFVHHAAIVTDQGHCDHPRGICARALSLLPDKEREEAKHEYSIPKLERLLKDARVKFRVARGPRAPEARSVKRA